MKPKGQDDASRWIHRQEADPSRSTNEEASGERSYTNNRFSLERFHFPKETCHVPMTRATLHTVTKD